MKVTEQIDAMRALGTDPIQKLVTPRMKPPASCFRCLTVIAISSACSAAGSSPSSTSDFPHASIGLGLAALDWKDVAEGLIKPFLFAFVIALIGCFYGLRASGGTQGVGKATTNAMVTGIRT
jgi:phospholipid/cholesterol/gamma-HCH transport system permease protein